MRPVIIQKWVKTKKRFDNIAIKWVPEGKLVKENIGKGTFLEWGVDYDERENGVGNYTTGIIELPDGSIINQKVELFKFDDKD